MDIDPGTSINREDCDERQARLDWMIDEFRTAQARRLKKANGTSAESQEESDRLSRIDHNSR